MSPKKINVAEIKMLAPDKMGYSVRNLKYMAKFAKLFPDLEFVQATLAQITWYHNITLIGAVANETPV